MKKWVLASAMGCFFLYFYYLAPHSERNYRQLTLKSKDLQKRLSSLEAKKNVLHNRMMETFVSENLNSTKSLLLSERNITTKNEILVEISPPITPTQSSWGIPTIGLILASVLLLICGILWKGVRRKMEQFYQNIPLLTEKAYSSSSTFEKSTPTTVSRTSVENSFPDLK